VDGTRSALIVASYDYTDPGLRRLRAPASDAQALAAVLRDPGIGGFDVRTLLNEPAHEVTLAVEEFFTDRRPDDLLLLHFSCHGVKDEDGELYLATANTVLRALGATAVPAEFVNRRMSRSRSRRVVLLLDCCYAGAFERGMTARAGAGVGIEAHFGGRGRAVITASSAMEYAFEGDELADSQELRPSVFTSALVEGLQTGDADRDQDGMVALDELYDYVYDKVRSTTPNQTPGKWTFGVQGDLYIARRAHPVTTPAPLHPELQEAIDSPFAPVRAAAVQELVRLLEGRHAGLALAARQTLERLTGDDSHAVAAAATAALGTQTPPQPLPPKLSLSATVVDFGRLPASSQSPERRIRLGNAGGGPLNARAVTQASWLHLHQVGDELVLEVDTTTTGERDGMVTVDSDGGSATIRVHARVDPEPLPAAATASTTHPAAAPEPPKRAHPAAQRDAGAASELALPPGGTAPHADPGPRLLVAGQLAIGGAALLVVGLFQAYQWTESLWQGRHDVMHMRWFAQYVFIMAALALGAGVCTLIPRTRRLLGPGLLLGIAAASTWGLLFLISDRLRNSGVRFGGGWWFELIAHAVLILASCVAGLALARAGEVRLARRLPQGELAWLVTLIGAVGALALLFDDQSQWHTLPPGTPDRWYVAPSGWTTILALVVPTCAAVAAPRRFGVALLAGWIAGAADVLGFLYAWDRYQWGGNIGTKPIITFGITLLALLVVTVLLARAAPNSHVERTT
jgi:hypothetical protein